MLPGNTGGVSSFVDVKKNDLKLSEEGDTMAQKRREKIFSEYPDVVTVKQMCVMLGGISMKTAYKLLECGDIRHLKIGKSFKIPKVCIIEYLVGEY